VTTASAIRVLSHLVAIDPSRRRGPTPARPPAEFSREIHGLLMGRLLLGPETRGTKFLPESWLDGVRAAPGSEGEGPSDYRTYA